MLAPLVSEFLLRLLARSCPDIRRAALSKIGLQSQGQATMTASRDKARKLAARKAASEVAQGDVKTLDAAGPGMRLAHVS